MCSFCIPTDILYLVKTHERDFPVIAAMARDFFAVGDEYFRRVPLFVGPTALPVTGSTLLFVRRNNNGGDAHESVA
jgi:hypothetical protein